MAPRDSQGNSPGSGKPKPVRAGWRGGAAAPPAVAAGATPRGWWKARPVQPARKSNFRLKLGISAAVLLILVGLFAYVISQRRTKVPLYAIGVTRYAQPALAPNSWAKEDIERFDERLQTADFGSGISGWFKRQFGGGAEVAVAGLDDNDWGDRDDALDELGKLLDDRRPAGGPGKDVVLVYISAHGAVNDNNEPCLLLGGANPVKSDTWLPVSKVLVRLRKAKPAQDGKPVKIVLVLDSNRMDFNWSSGLLYNNFVEQLEELVENENGSDDDKANRLFVLNSTGPGEVGRASPELRGSVFGYFFCKALEGDADGDDGRVSLEELVDYLTAQVNQWVVNHAEGSQRPLLLPRSADAQFPVANGRPRKTIRGDEAPGRLADLQNWKKEHAAEWQAVHKLWQDHDALKAKKLYRYDPLAWAWFERNLLRLEQCLLAGSAYQDDVDNWKLTLRNWVDSDPLKQTRYSDIGLASLPLAEQLSTATIKPVLAAPPAAAPSDKPAPAPYYPTARKNWDELIAKDRVNLADTSTAFSLASAAVARPGADAIEMHFLKMLDKFVDREPLSASAEGGDRIAWALKCRDRAERAAAPADERTQYWLTREVDGADAKRRNAEDLLFVGSSESRADEKASWLAATGAYEAASERATQLAGAFDTRDRGWAEAPYLAQWLCAWRMQLPGTLGYSSSGSAESQPQAEWGQLLQGIRALHELSDALDEDLAAGGSEGGLGRIAAAQKQAQSIASVATFFDGQAARLKTAALDQTTLARIERCLAIPLVAAPDRQRLREIHLDIVEKLARDGNLGSSSSQASVAAGSGELGSGTFEPLGELLSRDWLDGKAPAALASQDKETSRKAALNEAANLGAQARRLLSEAENQARQWSAAGQEPSRGTSAGPSDSTNGPSRPSLSKADRLMRASAACSAVAKQNSPNFEIDPARRLRELDLHQLLLWHCRRTLDDFWGSGEPGGTAYFEVVARNYLADCEKLCVSAKPQRQACEKLLQDRVAAAQQLLTARSKKSLVPNDKQIARLQLTASQAANLPPGIAATYLRNKEGATPEQLVPLLTSAGAAENPTVRRVAVAVAGEKEEPLRDYHVGPGSWTPETLATVALYRGHVRTAAIPPRGVQIEFKPAKPREPTITVRGDEKGTTAVMFILDCSYSMVAAASDGDGRPSNRLEVARNVLLRILEQLKKDNDLGSHFRVGLRIYGHRFTYQNPPDPKNPDKVMASPRYGKGLVPRPGDLPGTDVELVQPIGALDLQTMKNKLELLDPWGSTPLYLAICQSAERDFRAADQEKRIIVITDGFNTVPSQTPFLSRKTQQDVETALARAGNIKLDFVGFGSEFTKTEEANLASLQWLKSYAEKTQGKFRPAGEAKELYSALLESLSPGKFIVAPAGSRDIATLERRRLNEVWRAPGVPTGKTAYDVKVVDIGPSKTATTNVWLEGGEALQLFFEKSGPRLAHRRYDPENIERDGSVTDRSLDALRLVVTPNPGRRVAGGASRYWIAAHVPYLNRQTRLAMFDVSIQNNDAAAFSPRPAEAWIEITPLADNGDPAGEVCRFGDLDFVPGMPVPVLRCVVPQWKEGISKAQIELWCTFEKPTNPDTQTVTQLRRPYGVESAGVQLDAEVFNDRDAQDAISVVVSEKPWGDKEFKPGQVKIEMTDPMPTGVVHDFTAGQHTFYFSRAHEARIKDAPVRFTPRSTIDGWEVHCKLPPRSIRPN